MILVLSRYAAQTRSEIRHRLNFDIELGRMDVTKSDTTVQVEVRWNLRKQTITWNIANSKQAQISVIDFHVNFLHSVYFIGRTAFSWPEPRVEALS